MDLPGLSSAFLVLCILSLPNGDMAAFASKSLIGQAEDQANKLLKVLSSVKDSINTRNCNDLLNAGQRVSGLYTIFLGPDDDTGKTVYCDMDTDGGGWTVIQRRGQFGNPVYYFYRNWTEYAKGFGDPAKEHWIGNHALHALTSSAENMALRVVLTNHSGISVAVDYERMVVGPEKDYFKLKIGGHLGPPGWDSMSYHNGHGFSTFDEDHDGTSGSCATYHKGAWWYNGCHKANMNGLNFNGPHENPTGGIDWMIRAGSSDPDKYSFPHVQMMIRPNRA